MLNDTQFQEQLSLQENLQKNMESFRARPFYHRSAVAREHLMTAPALHIGTEDQALNEIPDYRIGRKTPTSTHAMELNPHTEIHPTVFRDDVANAAHMHLLREHGIAVPDSIYGSSAPIDESTRGPINEAIEALRSNRAIVYNNEFYSHPHQRPGEQFNENDLRNLSLLVPSPALNLRVAGTPVTQKSPPLPMDWAGVHTNPLTERARDWVRSGNTRHWQPRDYED